MRTVLIVLVQLVLAWLIVGALMPGVLYLVPATRGPKAGVAVTIVALAACFLVLRWIWRTRRRE